MTKSSKKYLIIFFTSDPKPPEVFYSYEMQQLLERVVELTKHKAKFTVYEFDKCIGDFS